MITRSSARGFTLFELLVVMAVMAIAFVAVISTYPRLSPAFQTRSAARELATSLRHARSRALTLNKDVRLFVDVRNGRFRVGKSGPLRELPESLEISLYTAQSELVEAQVGSVRFFPDGSSTGGRISLKSGTHGYHVVVDWLTGNVSIIE